MSHIEKDDWKLILKSSNKLTFQKDFVIMKEGEEYQRIYQIVRGSCVIEKNGVALRHLGVGEIFGEMSFIDCTASSASVIATDTVELFMIEGSTISKLLSLKPGLAGRFFKYLATILEERLSQRELQVLSNEIK